MIRILPILISLMYITQATDEELVLWSERSYYTGHEDVFLMLQCSHIGGKPYWNTIYSLLRKGEGGTYTEQHSSFTEFKRVQEGSYGEVYWLSKHPTLEDSGEYLCMVTQTPKNPQKNKGLKPNLLSAYDNFTVTILSISRKIRENIQKPFDVKTDEKMYIVSCWNFLMVDCDYTGGDPTANLYATLLKEVSPGEFIIQNTSFSDPKITRHLDGSGRVTWTSPKITPEDAGTYSCVLILDFNGLRGANAQRSIKTASDTFEIKVKGNKNYCY